MLVLHPSSECDVCFESYNLDDVASAPHSISCGHVFCKGCLDDLRSPHCPLCREPFIPISVTKLHLDPLPDNPRRQPQQGDDEAFDFLKRLVFSSYDNTTPEKLVDVMREADIWLDSQPPDSNELLRSAWVVFSTYQNMKDKHGEDEVYEELYRRHHEDHRKALQEAKEERDKKIASAQEEILTLRKENNQFRLILMRKRAEAEKAALRASFHHNLNERAVNPEAEVTQLLDTPNVPDINVSPLSIDPPFPGKFGNRGIKRHSTYSPPNGHPRATANNVLKAQNRLMNNHLRKLAENTFGGPSIPRVVPVQTPKHHVQAEGEGRETPPSSTVYAVALYDYEATQPDEMSLTQGETIEQIRHSGGDWWSGVGAHGSKKGMFPANYVQIIKQPLSPSQVESTSQAPPSTKKAVVLFEYLAVNDRYLTLSVGEIIEQVERVDDVWLRGIGKKSKRGIFPANFVQIVAEPSAEGSEETSQPAEPNVRACVLFDYEGTVDGDMCLVVGEIIEQIDQTNEDWWTGVGDGGSKKGLFPASYVKVLDQADSG